MAGKAGAEAMSVSGGVLGVNRTVASEGVPKEGSPLCSKEGPFFGADGRDKGPRPRGKGAGKGPFCGLHGSFAVKTIVADCLTRSIEAVGGVFDPHRVRL